MKILILEDDIELSLAMKQELLRNDYMVDCCHDGETGLLYALNAEFGYDLAIVDRMLPVIDGLTIIKAMRKKGISVPVIIITGMSSIVMTGLMVWMEEQMTIWSNRFISVNYWQGYGL